MFRVKILKPIDGYDVGDTPEVTGPRGRELIASGHAERADRKANRSPVKKAKA